MYYAEFVYQLHPGTAKKYNIGRHDRTSFYVELDENLVTPEQAAERTVVTMDTCAWLPSKREFFDKILKRKFDERFDHGMVRYKSVFKPLSHTVHAPVFKPEKYHYKVSFEDCEFIMVSYHGQIIVEALLRQLARSYKDHDIHTLEGDYMHELHEMQNICLKEHHDIFVSLPE